MSTFEERQRARVNALLAETMDDVASEMRKAVTPPAPVWDNDSAGCKAAHADAMPVGVRQEFDHYVYVNFSSPEFEEWFKKWFDRQVRAHGGMKAMIGRLR